MTEKTPPIHISNVVKELSEQLPAIAQGLVAEAEPQNAAFYADPDSPAQHAKLWHQYGIITHSREAERAYREEVPDYLVEWDVADQVNAHLSQKIDGISKQELLDIACLLHDLGKFAVRKTHPSDGRMYYTFGGHEVASGRIVRTIVRPNLEQQRLSSAQIEYIARCCELHYELAKMRDAAKRSSEGYTIASIESQPSRRAAEAVMEQYADTAPELGIIFLADSLGKLSLRIKATTDAEIKAQQAEIQAFITQNMLPTELTSAFAQLPINLAAARIYLQTWASKQL